MLIYIGWYLDGCIGYRNTLGFFLGEQEERLFTGDYILKPSLINCYFAKVTNWRPRHDVIHFAKSRQKSRISLGNHQNFSRFTHLSQAFSDVLLRRPS